MRMRKEQRGGEGGVGDRGKSNNLHTDGGEQYGKLLSGAPGLDPVNFSSITSLKRQ